MSLFDFQILQWFFITTSTMAESSEWKVICCFSDTTSVFNCNVKEKLFIGGQIVCFVDKSINRMKSLTNIFFILLYNFFIVIFKQNNKIFTKPFKRMNQCISVSTYVNSFASL